MLKQQTISVRTKVMFKGTDKMIISAVMVIKSKIRK